jgi:formate dehydrogenase alpha subunit
MTNPIRDLKKAACIMAIGTNTTEAHPVIAVPLKQAVARGTKLIVVNPRKIELVDIADVWLRPRPGTNVALLMGMARCILDENLQDQKFIDERCESFEAFRASLAAFDTEKVSDITGIAAEDIRKAARLYATSGPATILYAMGITQQSHGTDGVMAVANLAMITGNVGKPGTGVNPLRGQNNVQGACDMGGLPDVFPGYQRVDDEIALAKFETEWGRSLPGKPGLTLTQIFDAAFEGKIKAIYMMGENPVLSEPNIRHAREALSRLEFLVAQDIFLNDSHEFAHVVLPAASFAEKDGTFTNTERRVQRIRKAIEPPGEAKADWQIVCEVAKLMGATGFNFNSPKEIMDEVNRLAPIYGGISFTCLENGSRQWPCPSPEHPGTPVLHSERFSRGRGKFMPLDYIAPGEQADEQYPFVLTTGRNLYQFHTGTMTRKVPALNECYNEERIELNPQDASRLGIKEGEMVRVSSRRGNVKAKAGVTDRNPPGVVYMDFHFAETPTNILTGGGFDGPTCTPDFKVTAVNLEKLVVESSTAI